MARGSNQETGLGGLGPAQWPCKEEPKWHPDQSDLSVGPGPQPGDYEACIGRDPPLGSGLRTDPFLELEDASSQRKLQFAEASG